VAIKYPSGYLAMDTYYPLIPDKLQSIICFFPDLSFHYRPLTHIMVCGTGLAVSTVSLQKGTLPKRILVMKKLTIILLGILVSLLLGRYNSYISKKLLFEYIVAAYLSLRLGKLIISDDVNLGKA
jgi:hypothetical protein